MATSRILVWVCSVLVLEPAWVTEAVSHSALTMAQRAAQSSDQKRSNLHSKKWVEFPSVAFSGGRPESSQLLGSSSFYVGSEAGDAGPWCMMALGDGVLGLRQSKAQASWRLNVHGASQVFD